MIRLRTWATINAIFTKRKTTILINILKSQKANDDFSNLYINDWKKIKKRIGIGILHLVSINFKYQTKTLLDLRSKVNIISQTFALQLSFKIRKINIRI